MMTVRELRQLLFDIEDQDGTIVVISNVSYGGHGFYRNVGEAVPVEEKTATVWDHSPAQDRPQIMDGGHAKLNKKDYDLPVLVLG